MFPYTFDAYSFIRLLHRSQDVRHINNMAVKSVKTGAIILGGGLVKHHVNNANLMRNGADFAVYVNTGQVRRFIPLFTFPFTRISFCIIVLSVGV